LIYPVKGLGWLRHVCFAAAILILAERRWAPYPKPL